MTNDMEVFIWDEDSAERDYVDVWPAIRVIMRKNRDMNEAIQMLENKKIKEAITIMHEKIRLDDDQIIYILSTVLRKSLDDAADIYYKIINNTKRYNSKQYYRHYSSININASIYHKMLPLNKDIKMYRRTYRDLPIVG